MNVILLTKDDTFIIGWVARLLGLIMEGIFNIIDFIGIPNIGLAIILFTLVVNLLLLPLTIKQQKFSKLSNKMQPEIQAIQEKYKNKKDNESAIAQNQEIQAIYAKYGVSASGSCVQLLIQMPILLALYRVIYAVPAYVSKIGNTFRVLADQIITKDAAAFLKDSGIDTISNTVKMYGKYLNTEEISEKTVNSLIDVLNKLSSSDLATISEHYDLANLTFNGQLILSNGTTRGLLDIYNNFLGLNIANSPQHIILNAYYMRQWGLLIGAIMIPVLAALTQLINVKLMPQPENKNSDNSMASSMKMMNMIMPIFSAWLCFTLPSGMGLYWIASAVVRTILMIIINRQLDKMSFEEIIKKNSVKSAKKMEKIQKRQEIMNTYANMNTKNIANKAGINTGSAENTDSKKPVSDKKTTNVNYSSKSKPGSIAAKANMVKEYNEKNNK
ncbi:MAG: YidC/Oxa1 family membrane protein insertase [Lachnospiraceae bacterium]|nr:YidC/Oxa1 family membrane protein insertase [Lachnospiraceae bacterium]